MILEFCFDQLIGGVYWESTFERHSIEVDFSGKKKIKSNKIKMKMQFIRWTNEEVDGQEHNNVAS